MQILNRSKVDNHTADIAAAKNLYSMHVFFPTFLVWDLMTPPPFPIVSVPTVQ